MERAAEKQDCLRVWWGRWIGRRWTQLSFLATWWKAQQHVRYFVGPSFDRIREFGE
jgi:hypothetical protein